MDDALAEMIANNASFITAPTFWLAYGRITADYFTRDPAYTLHP